jgi:DNA-directed RNA polymerase sigma subunit (sigma70/sigma32)
VVSEFELASFGPAFDCGDLLRAAPETERSIIVRRFGLGGQAGGTLAAIGRDLSVTRGRVRQIEAVALRKLRARLEDAG